MPNTIAVPQEPPSATNPRPGGAGAPPARQLLAAQDSNPQQQSAGGVRGTGPLTVTNNNYPYDVTLTRGDQEGFGFVIISSVARSGSVIGQLFIDVASSLVSLFIDILCGR